MQKSFFSKTELAKLEDPFYKYMREYTNTIADEHGQPAFTFKPAHLTDSKNTYKSFHLMYAEFHGLETPTHEFDFRNSVKGAKLIKHSRKTKIRWMKEGKLVMAHTVSGITISLDKGWAVIQDVPEQN